MTSEQETYVKKGDRNPSKQTNYRGNKQKYHEQQQQRKKEKTQKSTNKKQQINRKMPFEALLVFQKKNKML